jgi:hypothetical protein
VRLLILFLICVLFAGPHLFRVPSPPVVVSVYQPVAAAQPGFWDRSEDRINGWMKRNLPNFVYTGAPMLFSPMMGTLKSLYGWSRTVTLDPQAGFIEFKGARAVLWMFYHPWISGFLGLLLIWRGRRWVLWPLRRVLFRRR